MTSENDQPSDFAGVSSQDKSLDASRGQVTAVHRYLADTAACIRFFSRLPLPPVTRLDDPGARPDFTRIAGAAPFAGVLVALPAAGLGVVLGYTALPALVTATLTVCLLALTTGALHEDGLSDVADGFFGAHDRMRRLEIMKDSRIGAFGTLALVLGTLLRVGLLAALWQRYPPADAALLFLAGESLSRALMVWQWQMCPPARPDGLAARFGKPGKSAATRAAITAAVLLLPAFLLLSLPGLLIGLIVAVGAAYACGRFALSRIGGVTGDVLGAIQQLSGLGFLLGMLMVAA